MAVAVARDIGGGAIGIGDSGADRVGRLVRGMIAMARMLRGERCDGQGGCQQKADAGEAVHRTPSSFWDGP